MPVYEYEGKHFDLPDGLTNEQAISKIKGHLDSTKLDGQMAKVGGVGEAALGIGSSMLSAIPQGLRTLGEMAGGADLDTALERSESSAEALTYQPRTQTGKGITKSVMDTLHDYQQEVGNKFAGDQARLNQKRMNDGTLDKSHLNAENIERAFGEVVGGVYVPGLTAPSRRQAPKETTKTPSKLEALQKKLEETSPEGKSDVAGDVARLHDQAILERLQEIDAQRTAEQRRQAAEGSKVVADESITVDPQGQAFRGDVTEGKARLGLEKQGEAFENAMDYNQWPKQGDPLPLLQRDNLKTANEGPQLPLGEEGLQHQFKAELETQATNSHPFVQAAEKRLTKQEELVIKLTEQVKKGKAQAATLAREVKNLEHLEQALEKTKLNVLKGAGESQRPVPFNFKKQGGAVNPAVFQEGFQKTKQVGEYTMELMGRSWGPEVRIFNKAGEDVGGLSTSATAGKVADRNLSADFVKILTPHQKKGLAESAYRFLA